ncbi:hypothetical protein INT47_001633 [Mucor saturninus]|uniref:Uncharacterized protein n=1 Tax=Mucor saturninus TaxID=64648 RepID=A0A8H7VF73_9FUNG|nr:hypothetical protein INT47_001633 [Mucor saturninus]
MNELANTLTKTFNECLESILLDPQQQKEEGNEGLDSLMTTMKATFLQLENELKEVRLNALSDRHLSVQKANELLKQDIEIKKNTIATFVTKLDEWDVKIPGLIENGKKAVALRTDGTDFDSDYVAPPQDDDEMIEVPVTTSKGVDDDDDDDEDEFEVVA